MAEPLAFLQRPYPSANAVLLTGPQAVLVDPGFGADVLALEAWLATQHGAVTSIVNTHFDCDHAGANHRLADVHGWPVAAHAAEAALVNARDPDACRARWLHQPIEPYRVAQVLHDGDWIDTGTTRWQVLHTPGHTAGHISLYAPAHRLLVAGDVVHADDLGWVDPHCAGALEQAEASVERLAALPVRLAYSGHGAVTTDPAAAFAQARRRLAGWRAAPERMAWHGVKRVFAYALMIEDGLAEDRLMPYLLGCPWFVDYAAHPFATSPAAFAGMLLDEMLRAGAARWRAGRLVAGSPFTPPNPGWAAAPTALAQWPR